MSRSRQRIDLAVVSDANFIEPIGVMLHSILRWQPADSLRLHWVHLRMDPKTLADATDLCRALGLEVNFVAGDAVVAAAGWPADVEPTILKIFLPEILTGVDEHLLHLDGDIVVEGPLWPLWQFDLRGGAVAAVRDAWVGSAGFWADIPPASPRDRDLWMRLDYINAGVLLYDVGQCRKLELARNCTRWLFDNRDAHFFDQDALNVALAGAITLAPPQWNVLGCAASYLRPPQPHLPYSAAELLHAYREPQVIHFAGKQKPWSDFVDWIPFTPRYVRARRHSGVHRELTPAERMHLTALELAYRSQCRGQLRTAGAILFVRRLMLAGGSGNRC